MKQYRNFYIRYTDWHGFLSVQIFLDEHDTVALASFTSPDQNELVRLAKLWIDETLKENRHFVRESRRTRARQKLGALQSWLS